MVRLGSPLPPRARKIRIKHAEAAYHAMARCIKITWGGQTGRNSADCRMNAAFRGAVPGCARPTSAARMGLVSKAVWSRASAWHWPLRARPTAEPRHSSRIAWPVSKCQPTAPRRYAKTDRKPAEIACCHSRPGLTESGCNEWQQRILPRPRSVKYKRAGQKPNSYQSVGNWSG